MTRVVTSRRSLADPDITLVLGNSPSPLTPGKYVQAILYLRGSRHRTEVGETKYHSKIFLKKKTNVYKEPARPVVSRLGDLALL